ncbi:hypothetical protein C2845_PM16G09010 [Panicum miliaceum]|uniref:PB1 domain-containing protein n=1 Tax=Panicum miliaceum TaxID=4540 RepID=A0A3L6PVP8_PANMI|nr:hypothetical protein C2845_PM16G09010 [Panicum miliaceum]
MQLVDFIAEHYLWGSKQRITLWRDLDIESIEITSDEQLLEWFQVNLEKEVVQIIVQINDFEGPLQFSPTKRRYHPSLRSRGPTNEGATSETATNVRAKSTSNKKRTTYVSVGVDEEGMGPLPKRLPEIASDTDSLMAPSDSSYDTDLAASSDSGDDCSDPKFDPDSEIVDDVDEFDPPPFSYDIDDPCIDVNMVFPDVDQCKSAVSHHELECNTESA